MARPKNLPEYVLVAFTCLLIGYGTGAVISTRKNSLTLGETVAVRWSDGIHNDPAYGAHVYLDPYMTNNFRGHAVRLRIFIGREEHEQKFTAPRHLGLAKTQDEAVRQWGGLQWTREGLYIGANNQTTFIPLDQITPQW